MPEGSDQYASLPPRQQMAAAQKWPSVGECRPRQDGGPWRVSVRGLVAQPRTWSLEELGTLPRTEQLVDIHCVTRWSKLGMLFGGVLLRDVLESCRPLADARFVSFIARSERNHSTSLPLGDALGLNTVLAMTQGGKPLPELHGGPVRTIVPGRYFYKSLKWLETIELLAEDRLGYWEGEAGYHNIADPWREQRYIAAQLDRREVAELVAKRDFSGRNLLGIEARSRDLTGLNAQAAQLRDAHFEQALLEGASFDGSNLSNAHFEGAKLRSASFRSYVGQNADLEGANFRGADLRDADFTGASLFAVTFCPEPGDGDGWGAALIDRSTRFDEEAIEKLTPIQLHYVRQALS